MGRASNRKWAQRCKRILQSKSVSAKVRQTALFVQRPEFWRAMHREKAT